MRPGNREHVSHVAMHTPRTPLHLGRPSRVQRYSSIMHRAMEEDSLMIRHEDECILKLSKGFFIYVFYLNIVSVYWILLHYDYIAQSVVRWTFNFE